MKEITVQELKEKKENAEDFFLVDVREYMEYLVSNLDGHHIPMGELQSRLDEIEENKDKPLIIMCRTGSRSGRVVQYLENQGFDEVYNLKGGIKKWAEEIDPSIPVA